MKLYSNILFIIFILGPIWRELYFYYITWSVV